MSTAENEIGRSGLNGPEVSRNRNDGLCSGVKASVFGGNETCTTAIQR